MESGGFSNTGNFNDTRMNFDKLFRVRGTNTLLIITFLRDLRQHMLGAPTSLVLEGYGLVNIGNHVLFETDVNLTPII